VVYSPILHIGMPAICAFTPSLVRSVKRAFHRDGGVGSVAKTAASESDWLQGISWPRATLFKWWHFEPEIIVCAVRRYL
jgi:hypothetical protein